MINSVQTKQAELQEQYDIKTLEMDEKETGEELDCASNIISMPKNIEGGNDYSVNFRIKYETKFGQSLCIVGNIPELGNWKDFTASMTWHEDNFWDL